MQLARSINVLRRTLYSQQSVSLQHVGVWRTTAVVSLQLQQHTISNALNQTPRRLLSSSSSSSSGHRFDAKAPKDDSSGTKLSLIEKAAKHGVESLLGPFTHRGGFDSCLSEMTVTRLQDGVARTELPITPNLTNSWGTLHGGAISTCVDVLGTLALLAHDAKHGGVSVEMSTSFCNAIKLNDTLLCEGRVDKAGRTLGFTTIELRRKSDGKIVALGRHTKAL